MSDADNEPTLTLWRLAFWSLVSAVLWLLILAAGDWVKETAAIATARTYRVTVPMLAHETAPKPEFTFMGWRYESSCITHSGEPSLDLAIAAAILTWGLQDCGSGTDIVITFEPSTAYTGIALPTLRCGEDCSEHRIIVRCDIHIDARMFYESYPRLTAEQQQAIVTHEVGHCAGLAHTPGGIMDAVFPPRVTISAEEHEAVDWLYN